MAIKRSGMPRKNTVKATRKTRPGTDSKAPTELAPVLKTIAELRKAAAGCQACDLSKTGTQTVFGEGPSPAKIMFVGEQPGDQEDRAGHPFVGAAGKLLDHRWSKRASTAVKCMSPTW
jgi:DNA polymerase